MERYKRAVIFIAGLFLWVSAALTGGPNLYLMSSVVLTLPLVSYGLGLLASREMAPRRLTPATVWEGETATLQLVIKGSAWLPRVSVWAQDDLPVWLQVVPGSVKVAPGTMAGETQISYDVEFRKRGAYVLDRLTVVLQDPLGIFSFRRTFSAQAEIVVYPTVAAVEELSIAGADRFGARDSVIALLRGAGTTPDGVREYVFGDPLRRVHWRSTAHTGRLTVIECEEPHAVNVVFLVDRYAKAQFGEGLEQSFEVMARAAASLAEKALDAGASVRVLLGGHSVGETTDRGRGHLLNILAALARANGDDPLPLSARIPEWLGVVPAGTTLVILTPTADSELIPVLAHYATMGCHAAVIVVAHDASEQERKLVRFRHSLDAIRVPLSVLHPGPGRAIRLVGQ